MARSGSARVPRLAGALLRWPVFAPLALCVAAGLWLAAGPWLSQRTVSFDIAIARAGPCWALEWQRAADQRKNGAWLDLVDNWSGPETLEIRPSGSVTGTAENTELWLYEVVPLRPEHAPIDLKSLIRTTATADLQGHWVPFDAGSGIVYSDARPGLLRLSVPAGGVALNMAKTQTSGPAKFTYADDTQSIELHSAATGPVQLVLTRKNLPVGQPVHVVRSLPHYRLAVLTLRWQDSSGTDVSISNPKLVQRVFGVRIKSRPLNLGGDGCQPCSAERPAQFEFRSDAPTGTIVFQGDTDTGRTANVIGVVGLWLILLALRLTGRLVAGVGRLVRSWGTLLDGMAGVVVVTVHLGMAAWAPLLLTPDSLDYVGDAAALLETGSLSHFGFYRTPGYAVFAAPFLMVFRDFATALGYAQAVLGILTAYFAYRIVQAFLPRPWPALALLLVGLDPVLLTYERYALSECLTTFCVALVGWLLVWQYARYCISIPRIGSMLVGALTIGIVCGLSAYVRPNLQMLIVLVPPALVWVCWRAGARWRLLAQAALALAVALACVSPWLLRNQARYGRAALALATQTNRAGGLWNFGALDINQTAVFSYERWHELRQQQAQGRLSVYDVAPAIVNSPEVEKPTAPSVAVQWEEIYRRTANEAVARHPGRAVRSMGIALASQLGLWPKFDHPSAAENIVWSSPLRGEVCASPTNFPPLPAEHWNKARLIALAQRSQRDITFLRESTAARWFNELYWAYRQARPLMALLFLAGLITAFAARVYPLTVLGLLALGNAAALAVLVFSPIDRYSAPFLPFIELLALYTLSCLRPHALDQRCAAGYR